MLSVYVTVVGCRAAESAGKMDNFPERLKLFEKFPSLKNEEEDGLPARRAKISPDFKNFPERHSRTRVDSAPLVGCFDVI